MTHPELPLKGRLNARFARASQPAPIALPGNQSHPSNARTMRASGGASKTTFASGAAGRGPRIGTTPRPALSGAEAYARMMRGALRSGDCLAFLCWLDAAPFEVSDWEAGFVGSVMEQTKLSAGQRRQVERLIAKYGSR